MTYETPEILDLGPVERLTFGGCLAPSSDYLTDHRGFIQDPEGYEEEL
jgi:hypothetical protein